MKKHNDLFLTRLRKSSAVLAVLCWFAAMETGAAQGTADGYLYVYPLAQSAQPSSGNATLAPIFSNTKWFPM